MKWIKVKRMDGRIEYNCEHGVGHGVHNHGCDGCCSREDYPPTLSLRKKWKQKLRPYIVQFEAANAKYYKSVGNIERQMTKDFNDGYEYDIMSNEYGTIFGRWNEGKREALTDI